MLTLNQYQILEGSCADDWEIFYYPFAEINYGGQVYPRSIGSGYAQYDDEKDYKIIVPGEDIAEDIRLLILEGFLSCRRTNGELIHDPDNSEFEVYRGYKCLLFEDHMDKFDYGPHEFKSTLLGRQESAKKIYRKYDHTLGWEDE